MAYRHWSLDSAMFYSDYVATRLRDSDADDSFESLRAQLDKLQALCGVPAKLFRQDYKYMPRPDSDRVRLWLSEPAPALHASARFLGRATLLFLSRVSCPCPPPAPLAVLRPSPANHRGGVL